MSCCNNLAPIAHTKSNLSELVRVTGAESDAYAKQDWQARCNSINRSHYSTFKTTEYRH